ncbi:MAG: serine/threonine protein phosphatase [Clostridiaceae bacterium]|nr:serine/threonine protein phosphatase [Clostridiaceae bacterium]
MAVFAIADLHLGFGVSKPMSVFGTRWEGHEQLLAERWQEAVAPGDTVLIPGDISWAMTLEEALPDLSYLDRLPGRKILSRGNHDYWWTSLAKIERFCREMALESLTFMRNNSFAVGPDIQVCGTRGWLVPEDPEFQPEDEKIYLREAGRLQLSLEAAVKTDGSALRRIVCLHYPPFGRTGQPTLFTELLSRHEAGLCVYGHIHGAVREPAVPEIPGARAYRLVAADYLNFRPLRLDDLV